MVEALGIIIDRHPKGRPRKRENYTIEKIGCPYFNYKTRGRSVRKKKFFHQKNYPKKVDTDVLNLLLTQIL